MNERIDRDERSRRRLPGDGTDPEAAGLGAEGAQFLNAADEAIARVLSGNAEQFLRANRQQGGQ